MRDAHGTVAGIVLLWMIAAAEEVTPRDGMGGGPLGRLAGHMRDRMLDVVGPDEIVERLDVNAVLERVDVNALLDRIDADRLLDRVEVNRLLDRVDINTLLDRVDVDQLLMRVDVNAVLDRVEVNRLLDRADVNTLLDRVEVDRLLDRVDVDRLLDRADPDRLLARVDVDAVMERVDVERLVQRAGIPDIVAESTGSVAESALDLLRRQLLALDVVLTRAVMRVLGRDDASVPAGPSALAGEGGPTHSVPVPNAPVNDVSGHYAGAITRAVAHALDVAAAGATFSLASSTLLSTLRAVGVPIEEFDRTGTLFLGSLAAWVFLYWWTSTAVAGRTPGMAVVGLRIVDRTGEPISGRRALVRVLTLPLSILLLGLGLVGIVVGRERRALHDVLAGSTVVYDWGDRRATMPTPLARWLAQHAAPIDPPPGEEVAARRRGA